VATKRTAIKLRKLKRSWRRASTKNKAIIVSLGAVAVLILVANLDSSTSIHPAAYKPLLETIAKGESNGNYNAYFGSSKNSEIKFTKMSIRQVLDWQAEYVNNGSPSNAVGKYQIIRPTLEGLVEQLQLDLDQAFDEATQDMLAITLLERRGSIDYVAGKLTTEQFAANLAKEWAALPKVTGHNPVQSYYAGDGLNRSLISVDEILLAVQRFKQLV